MPDASPAPASDRTAGFTAADLAWVPINVLQAVWLAVFSVFCFFLSLFILFVTWSPETALGIARCLYGDVNIALNFSKVVVEGRENFPRDKPYVMMMNHQSMADIIVAWMVAPDAVRFIAKRQLMFIPVVGWTMLLYSMVWIDRDNVRNAMNSLKRAAKILKAGTRLAAFPEGTRSRDGTIAPFKKGVFVLAAKSGVPIVPVAIEGAATFVPVSGWKPRPVVIRVRVGAPIPTRGRKDKERDKLIKDVRNAIIDMHLAIGGKGGDRENAVSGRTVGAHVDIEDLGADGNAGVGAAEDSANPAANASA